MPWAQLLADAPLSPKVRSDIVRIQEAAIDYMPGLTSAEKKTRLAAMSYRDYLLNVVKADPGVIPFYQTRTHGEWGVGIDAVSALDVWAFEFPGFSGLDLERGSAPHTGYTANGYADNGGSYTFHFPDGNASIARLLVRDLIPESVPGNSAEDVVTARVDYARLDRPKSPVRIRLGSTVVRARNVGDPASSSGVEIAYFRGGDVYTVRGRACVLACWNMMIPYLCPELPPRQKEALRYLVKTPLIYANVALRNWTAFKALGVVVGLRAGLLLLVALAQCGRRYRRLQKPALAGRADAGAHGAHAVPARGCRSATRTGQGSTTSSTPRSRPSSATSATSWRASSVRAGSMRRAV